MRPLWRLNLASAKSLRPGDKAMKTELTLSCMEGMPY